MDKSYPEIKFGFDKNWELRNWYQTCTQKVRYGLKNGSDKWDLGDIPTNIAEIVSTESSEEKAIEKISPVFNEFINSDSASNEIKRTIDRAQKRWSKIGEKYFSALSSMLEIPINEFEKQYFAFFTFSRRCPFNGDKFMFNKFNDFSNTAAHEIMHIEFFKKYASYCKERGLSEIQISHLKEILTVLLNADMTDVLYHPDRGYKKHEEIRPKVLELYHEQKRDGISFVSFLNKIISLVKEHSFDEP
ncbi:MAG: hypothetical protein AAB873_00140 [Patescibacteria group bacterium]